MDTIKQNWKEILLKTKEEHDISDISFNTWLEPLSISKIENNTVTILVSPDHGQMGLDHINRKYKLALKVAISEFAGSDFNIEFVLPKEKENISKNSVSHSVVGLNPRYTFDTFVVGSNNKFAHAAALAAAESPGKVYNPLFLYGGVGLGKTHLMHSIGHFISENKPEMNILYVTSEQFTNEVIEAIRNGNNTAITKFRDKYRNIDVLLVDDIQFIIGKESTQEEFFHTFNALYDAGKQIVISSDRPPKDMNILEERIRSRFEWGLMADIQSPDFETRIAILQKKQELDGFYVSKEVTEYIAENVKSNIRELEGSLTKVIALANIEKKDITTDLARKALKDIITPKEKKVVTPDLIIEEVASYYGITVDDIKGTKRSNKIANPRQLAMYLCRELTNVTLNNIGDLFGGKDHTTVIYATQKIEKSLSDPASSLSSDIENIKKMLST